MADKKIMLEGTTKRIYAADKKDQIIIQFKDAETLYDGEKKSRFKNKGILKNNIAVHLFEYLCGYNIPNHFIARENDNGMRVKKLNMIPITVMVRNISAGTLVRRFRVEKGIVLKYPILEYYLRDEKLNNPMVLESHAYAFGYATPEEMKHISRLSSKVNAVLKSYLERRNLKLVDFKLEFGRTQNQIYVSDEITPDTARLWDISNGKVEEGFSIQGKAAEKSYNEIYQRIIGE